jgi:uncharacterized membrane protein YjjP (DUF1212 family)
VSAVEPQDEARDFVLELGHAMHTAGHPAHRLEEALEAVSARLGLAGQFFSTPTALMASFGRDQRSHLLREQPGQVDLQRLVGLEEVARAVARGELRPAAGTRRVAELLAAPVPYGPALTTLAYALSSGAASRFFGGGLREVVASTLVGLAIGVFALLCARVQELGRLFEPLAAVLASTLAVVLAHQAGPLAVYTTTVSGLIVLMPGFSLTVALMELSMRHLSSGTARLAGVVATFLAIGFGVAFGTRLSERLLGVVADVTPVPLPGWTLGLALLVAPLGFTVLLQASKRDAPFIVAAGAAAFHAARIGAELLGPELGAFVGALAVGLLSNLYSRLMSRPAVVTLVPGMLLLVPGSMGFLSFASMLDHQTVIGVEAAFRMLLVAASLATGMLFASALLPAGALADEPERPPR